MPDCRWEHILLDPRVYTNGTHRVARVLGGINAFPRGRTGTGTYASNWHPTDRASGIVPDAEHDHYRITATGRRLEPGETDPDPSTTQVFRFAFWSFHQVTAGGQLHGGRTRDMQPSLPSVVAATAYFVWDFGNGPGGHFVYMDAFDESSGTFIGDDFVYVEPDEPSSRPRTGSANEGVLPTEGITSTDVVAHERLTLHDFVQWDTLFAPEQARAPDINGNTLRVEDNDIAHMLAFYDRSNRKFPRVETPPVGWQYVLSGQAGGAVLVLGGTFPTGEPGPAGPQPGDTYHLGVDKLNRQVLDLDARLQKLEALIKKQ